MILSLCKKRTLLLKIKNIWASEYGGKMFFSNGESNCRGVAICTRRDLDIQINKIQKDEKGRFIIIDSVVNEKPLLLVNIYAPNEDEPQFFAELFCEMAGAMAIDRVIAGDFNLVLDPVKDAYNRKSNNSKACHVIQSYMDEAQMVDIWRYHNKDDFKFTWFKKRPDEIYARLDYVLVNYALVSEIDDVKICPAYRTDHSSVSINVNTFPNLKRGPGFWKLNISIFDNQQNTTEMNERIETMIEEYKEANDSIRWEMVKAGIIKHC